MLVKLIRAFFETLAVAVGVILFMWFIGYVPPNPRIFNMVDRITFFHLFSNRIYDNWIMLALLFATGTAIFEYFTEKKKNNY
ncbi:hypothetical protein DOS81_03775 [Staphylococcus felis]|uniref:hypothetical protein n=1 Tax=Staphylococcus felis TaxID=46127 RepID=UPI000E250AF6|nr:hypothetical protein [Staphylococcus felis]REH76595.1 hypothetical protein DOS57_07920 [Staphylococcus felis]REI30724.1 hypothetical protein DOS81_03775 [Staphylococcus felis]